MTAEKRTFHIICIDDDVNFLSSISSTLPKTLTANYPDFNYKFEFVSNSTDFFEAFQKFNSKNLALIISDQRMPDMTGIDIFSTIKDKIKHTYRILLTGYSCLNIAKHALNNEQIDYYIPKPINDFDSFSATIYNFITKFHEKTKSVNKLGTISDSLNKKILNSANSKVNIMLSAAEAIMSFSRELKVYDLDFIVDSVVERLADIFKSKYVSLLLLKKVNNEHRLNLVKSTNLKKVGFSMHVDNSLLLGINQNENHLYSKDHIFTPIQKAIIDNDVLIVKDVLKSNLKIFNNIELGNSCIVIPFFFKFKASVKELAEMPKDQLSQITHFGGVITINGLDLSDDELEIYKYKSSLVRDLIGTNIINAQVFSFQENSPKKNPAMPIDNVIMNEFIKKEIDSSRRGKKIFSFLLCRIANVDAIHKKFGPEAKKDLLINAANLLNETKREYDMFFKYSTRKFALILPETNLKQASKFIKRCMDKVERLNALNENKPISLNFCLKQYSKSVHNDTNKDLEYLLKATKAGLDDAVEKGVNVNIIEA